MVPCFVSCLKYRAASASLRASSGLLGGVKLNRVVQILFKMQRICDYPRETGSAQIAASGQDFAHEHRLPAPDEAPSDFHSFSSENIFWCSKGEMQKPDKIDFSNSTSRRWTAIDAVRTCRREHLEKQERTRIHHRREAVQWSYQPESMPTCPMREPETDAIFGSRGG